VSFWYVCLFVRPSPTTATTASASTTDTGASVTSASAYETYISLLSDDSDSEEDTFSSVELRYVCLSVSEALAVSV